jgi:hypothetical protein
MGKDGSADTTAGAVGSVGLTGSFGTTVSFLALTISSAVELLQPATIDSSRIEKIKYFI